DPDGPGDEQGPDLPDGAGARPPLDRRPAAPDRGRPDRPFLRHHPQGRPVQGAGDVPHVPRQGGQLHQGHAPALNPLSFEEVHVMPLTNATQIARSEGDPIVEKKGPSSLTGPDRLARALGWFSIGLGVAELVAPGKLARMLGLEDKEGLIRAYGARELASAVPTLSVDKPVGLASRIAGDALDLGTL